MFQSIQKLDFLGTGNNEEPILKSPLFKTALFGVSKLSNWSQIQFYVKFLQIVKSPQVSTFWRLYKKLVYQQNDLFHQYPMRLTQK